MIRIQEKYHRTVRGFYVFHTSCPRREPLECKISVYSRTLLLVTLLMRNSPPRFRIPSCFLLRRPPKDLQWPLLTRSVWPPHPVRCVLLHVCVSFRCFLFCVPCELRPDSTPDPWGLTWLFVRDGKSSDIRSPPPSSYVVVKIMVGQLGHCMSLQYRKRPVTGHLG